MTLRSLPSVRTLALAAVLATGAFFSFAGQALASSGQFSIMQDDRLFINSGGPVQQQAVADTAALGPHIIHVVINWRNLAPNPNSTHKPTGVNLSSPAAYDAGKWDAYDNLVRFAQASTPRLDVLYSAAGPAPEWALKCSKSEKRKYGKVKGTCKPDPTLYGQFVRALGTRYSGNYPDENVPGNLPRVTRWSIWNEPDLPSWLSPQIVKKGRTKTDIGAMVYRNLAYSALSAFQATGHTAGRDTILLGETAPIGGSGANATPQQFYQGVFCLDSRGHRLRGKAAKTLGCKKKLKRMNVSGIAHHPYTRGAFTNLLSKQKSGNATIAYIPRLLHILHQGAHAKVISSAASKRIYWTEFGVSSRPPAAARKGVSLATQAEWINQMQFISYLSRNVQSVVQFQLSDDANLSQAAGGKGTFQTGLRFADNSGKPALDAYRVPLYVLDIGHGKLEIWGGARPATGLQGQTIRILNGNTTVKTVTLGRNGYFLTTLPKRGGTWRLQWTSPFGQVFTSRTAKAVKKKKAIASRK
ncbi:MAG: hypothetical protein ACJ77M_06880 [Thermoleophilaceae bacterium]